MLLLFPISTKVSARYTTLQAVLSRPVQTPCPSPTHTRTHTLHNKMSLHQRRVRYTINVPLAMPVSPTLYRLHYATSPPPNPPVILLCFSSSLCLGSPLKEGWQESLAMGDKASRTPMCNVFPFILLTNARQQSPMTPTAT